MELLGVCASAACALCSLLTSQLTSRLSPLASRIASYASPYAPHLPSPPTTPKPPRYVTSDSGAVYDIFKGHHFTSNWTSTVASALNAGCDVESAMWGKGGAFATDGPYIQYTGQAIKEGLTTMGAVDTALRHAVGLRFELGLFDPIDDQPYWKVPPEVVASDAHTALTLDATRQGLVLLQNGGGDRTSAAHRPDAPAVLPFKGGLRTAVIGPHTNDRDAILGNYLGQICPKSLHSREGVSTAYEAIAEFNRKAAAASGHVAYTVNATGVDVNTSDTSRIDAALAAAKDVDVIVYVGGLDVAHCERESHDRHEVGLPGMQPQLLSALLNLGKPTAFVIYHGGVLTIPPAILAKPNLAIVSAGYPGVHGARAIAEALFDGAGGGGGGGDGAGAGAGGSGIPLGQAVNRFGRTAVTWYSEDGWRDAAFDMLSFDMARSPGRTHRYYTGVAQWPFGFGLSYGAPIRLVGGGGAAGIGSSTAAAGSSSTAGGSAAVGWTRAGSARLHGIARNDDDERSRDAIVMVYASPAKGTVPPSAPAAALRRQLIHFERLSSIAPRTDALIDFEVSPSQLTMHDAQGRPVFYPGSYEITVSVGGESADVVLPFTCAMGSGGCQAR